MLKIKYNYHLFSLLSFLRTAILDFMTSYGCRYCQLAEVLLCETIEQQYDVMKSYVAAPGKFESENRRKSNPVLCDTDTLFPFFQRNLNFRLFFQQFIVDLFQEWRFLLIKFS